MNSPYLLPAAPFLLSALSCVFLAVHMLLMNLTLGGTALVSIYLFKSKEKHLTVAEAMARRLPYFMAFTILFGMAPMILSQTLYSPVHFTSAVYLSGTLLLVPAGTLVSYTILFLLSEKWSVLGKARKYLCLIAVFSLGTVVFVFNRLSAVMENLKERDIAAFGVPGGYSISPDYLQAIPRFLFFFLASVAVSGLWVAVWGIMKLNREPEQGRWQYRSGATWFSSATILSMATGFWWLSVMPGDPFKMISGGSVFATTLFIVLSISAAAALAFALLGMNSIKPSFFLRIAAALTIFNIAGMVVMRDLLRLGKLSGFYEPAAQRSSFQWAAFLIFVLCCTVSLFFCVDLVKKTRSGRKNS